MTETTGTYTALGGTPADVSWATQIETVRNAALALLEAQQAEDRAQALVATWKATTLLDELLSGRINGSNDRIRKAQEDQFLATRLDYLDLLQAHQDAQHARRKAEVELEYARLRERFWRAQNQATTVAP